MKFGKLAGAQLFPLGLGSNDPWLFWQSSVRSAFLPWIALGIMVG